MTASPPSAADRACAACAVRDVALCRALSAEELASLNRAALRRRVRRGEPLLPPERETLAGNLIAGAAKRVVRDGDGHQQVTALLQPGDLVGRLAGPGPETIALSLCEVCLFPRERLADALRRFPAMERLLRERTEQALAEAEARLLALVRQPAAARVKSLLVELSARAGGGWFTLPLTRSDMADFLALSPESVSRAMGAMKAAGELQTQGRRLVRLSRRS